MKNTNTQECRIRMPPVESCTVLDCPKPRHICRCETKLCEEHHWAKFRIDGLDI